MGSLSLKNKNIKYLLCAIDVFTNAFIEIVHKSNRKPNKLWVDQGREFYKETYARMVKKE